MEDFKNNETKMMSEIKRLNDEIIQKNLEIQKLKQQAINSSQKHDIDPYINLNVKSERMPYHQQQNKYQTKYVPLGQKVNFYDQKVEPTGSKKQFDTPIKPKPK